MEYSKTNGTRVRLLLTDEELGLPAVDEMCLKFKEWIAESRGRKTRAANRKADQLYDEIMSFQLPPIKINLTTLSPQSPPASQFNSDTSCDSDSASTTSLRPNTRQGFKRTVTSPSTPAQQRIRSHLKKPPSGGSQNVLSAALDQKHPSVSVSKIRQLLNADSAQKKREEEKERQERLMSDRKAKEERAEAQKKQLLEQRAITAKLKREQRLLHAAEVRKEREEARRRQKLNEEAKKAQTQPEPTQEVQPPPKSKKEKETKDEKPKHALNETFKKPLEEIDNIEIVISDDSSVGQKEKVQQYASWTQMAQFRNAIIKQFSNNQELLEEFKSQIPPECSPKGPIDLAKILGSKSLGNRCLVRTSSAVWSPVHKPLKRSCSNVPNDER